MNSASEERGLLISHLHDQFWSAEYYAAAQLLRGWKAEWGVDWAPEFFRCLDGLNTLGDDERARIERVNAARRLIKSYFRKAQQLCVRGFLSDADLRDHLTMPQRLQLLFLIIEPLERARKAQYQREMFDFYDVLQGRELERPER